MSGRTRLDVWLERLSYIAQLGLFAVTLFTIYYTVIPLYQNANLQEAIAKKEVELKELKKESDVLYVSLRHELLSRISSSVMINCDPAMSFIMRPSGSDNNKSFNDRIDEIKVIMGKDLYSCIKDQQKNSPFVKKLKESDRIELSNAISNLQNPLEEIRLEFNRKVKNNDLMKTIGSEDSEFTRGLDKLLEEQGITIDINSKEFDESSILSGTRKTLLDYGHKYKNIVSAEFEKLNSGSEKED